MKRLSILVSLFALIVATNAVARPYTVEEKLTDFRGLVAQIKSGYGPIQYKKNVMGIDIDVLAPKYEARIMDSRTNRDFYYAVVQFIAEFKDGHFNASVPTTHQKQLPFMTDLVQGKVLIDSIDRDVLSEAAFPFERGDELVMFDGREIGAVVDEIATYIQSGTDLSIRRKAVWTIPLRRGSRLPVPVGMEIGETKIKHSRTGRIETVTAGLLKWKESGEALDEFDPENERHLSIVKRGTDYGMLSVRDQYEDLLGSRIERSYACNPGTRVAIPAGATILMNPPNGPFTAYYHYDERFGGNVGYIRIPDYYPVDAQGNFQYEQRFAQYQYAVQQMERNTVGLIIDQDHNCGGSVEYLERILGLFMSRPYRPMMFELLATKESYFDLKSWMDEIPPFTVDRDRLTAVLNLVRDTSEARLSWLTPKTSITGRDFYQPNEIRYTKPIVVLADEVSGSGGDAFPSLMGFMDTDGNPARALLVGTQTAGLGGHVVETTPLYYTRTGGRLTKSLFYRADGVPVENIGAVPAPENRYSPTYNDFVDGYREYQAYYLGKLLALVKSANNR